MDIFEELNVPQERRTEEYRRLLIYGDEQMYDGLQYGCVYYIGNEKWLQQHFDPLPEYIKTVHKQMAEEFWDDE